MDRIEVIRKSLAAYVYGLFGLLPIFGLPFGLAAIVLFVLVRKQKRPDWNPAERYLDWSVWFALIGVVLSLVLIGVLMALAIQRMARTGHGYGWMGDD